jgi:GT2 family glycosyltransferase
MKVCIFSVCHNSYSEAIKYLKSIEASLDETKTDLELFFIDNSTKVHSDQIKLIKSDFINFNIKYIKCENLGYFPSIAFTIEKYELNIFDYDYTIISNVDLQISKDFFLNLLKIPKLKSVGVFAPSIYSEILELDRNPKIFSRPPSFKLKLNKILYSTMITFLILKVLNISRLNLNRIIKSILKSSDQKSSTIPYNIYAPHGSFIILTKEFIRRVGKINYPVFLFCEEIYLAEKANEHQLKVQYRPDLLVYDSEHASTSLMKSKDYRNFNIEALSYILNKYKF